jgi:hypothetical protein
MNPRGGAPLLGVKTIGNATLIAFDGDPVLVTDPWIGDDDPAYFGSWTLSHEIPAAEKDEILRARSVWFSHGHPDHLNPISLERFRGRKILLADHVGGRIARDLSEQGFDVCVLPDRRWIPISARVKVMAIADPIQDSLLLIDVGGALFVNLNDCAARGAARIVRRIAREYRRSYVLRLAGYGDADMIHFVDEEGDRVPVAHNPVPVGRQLSDLARNFGANHVIPFSSFHRYQRSDSVWANAHTTPVSAMTEGFDSRVAEYVEPFVAIDAETGRVTPLHPAEIADRVQAPEVFGDRWHEELEKEDEARVAGYFQRLAGLQERFGFVRLVLGGRSLDVRLNGPAQRGVRFEVPRASLMAAIEHRIFDDLLIGNFMRTTLYDMGSLYDPDFTLTVAKYGDNAGVETPEQLRAYLSEYRQRAGLELSFAMWIDDRMRSLGRRIDPNARWYRTAKRLYYTLH